MKTDEYEICQRGMARELGLLVQGYKDMKGYNNIYFISKL